MVASEVTGRIPGSTGVRTPRASRSATSPSYSEASKKNWVTPKSAISSLAARKSRSLSVLGERGCPAGWAATPTEKPPMARASSTSSAGVGQLTGPGVGIGRGVAAQRHQVLDAGLAQRDQDVGQLQPGVRHADEVGHGVERGGVQHAAHQVEGALARRRPAPVGHRDERGAERLELADGAGEGGQLGVVLRREELEGVRLPGRQEVGDPGHWRGSRHRPGRSRPRAGRCRPRRSRSRAAPR